MNTCRRPWRQCYGPSNFFLHSLKFRLQNWTNWAKKKKAIARQHWEERREEPGQKWHRLSVLVIWWWLSTVYYSLSSVPKAMFEKDIILLKGHERGTKKIRIRAHGLPEGPHLKIHHLSLGKTYVEIKAILHRSNRFAYCILFRIWIYKIGKLHHLWPKKMVKVELGFVTGKCCISELSLSSPSWSSENYTTPEQLCQKMSKISGLLPLH